MKKITIAIIVVLFVTIAAETFFLVNGFTKRTALDRELLIEQNNSMLLSSQVDTLTDEKQTLTTNLTTLDSQLAALEEEKTNLLNENNLLLEESEALKESVKQKTTQISKLTREKTAITDKFMCDRTISNVDFSTNKSVSDSLVDYVMDTKSGSEPVSANYWNTVWTGEKYSIHTVAVFSAKDNTNYIWKFTAYFKGEAYGDHVNGIFYNDQQCWLYLDK